MKTKILSVAIVTAIMVLAGYKLFFTKNNDIFSGGNISSQNETISKNIKTVESDEIVTNRNIEDELELSVSWLKEPKAIPIINVLNDLAELNDSGEYYSSNGNFVKAFQIGTIETRPYQNAALILLAYPHGMGSVDYYRVIKDKISTQLIFLSQISPEPQEEIQDLFTNAPNFSVPDLAFPLKIAFPGSQRSLVTNKNIPNSLFPGGEIVESIVVTRVNTLPGLTDMPENLYVWNRNTFNSFVLKLPDNTVKFYDFDLPGKDIEKTDLCSIKGCLHGTDMTIDLSKGGTHFATYVVSYINSKNGWHSRFDSKITPQLMDDYIKQNTKYIGSVEGERIVAPIERNNPLYTENWLLIDDDHNLIFKEDDYLKYPLILWKDPMGRWLEFVNKDLARPIGF